MTAADVVLAQQRMNEDLAVVKFVADLAAERDALLADRARLEARMQAMTQALEHAETLCELVRDWAGHDDVGKCYGEMCADCFAATIHGQIHDTLAVQPAAADGSRGASS